MLQLNDVTISYKREFSFDDVLQITSPDIAYKILLPYFESVIDYKECFYVMYLNQANKQIKVMKISEGGIAGTIVDIRIILQGALLCNATNIILAHNHPSGQLKPSQADIKITERIEHACKIFDISLLDHIILTSESFISIKNL